MSIARLWRSRCAPFRAETTPAFAKAPLTMLEMARPLGNPPMGALLRRNTRRLAHRGRSWRGEQVSRRMPVLSTYLGHVNISGTYWYLGRTPELMAAASKRIEARWKGVV